MGLCGTKVQDNTRLGRHHFEFQIIIGQGGFGKVNAVIRKGSKPPQWFAIKTMHKRQILNKGKHGLEMLFNERTLLADLKSEYVINMHHCFQDEDSCYIVMDLMLGGDLRFHMARREFFAEKDARFYVAAAMLSINAVHEAKILHRDMKPDNIVLDVDGYCKLTDFGISVRFTDENPTCKLGSGTKPYMAPEMLSKSHEHGVEGDWWMIGIMMFELLTGKRPYKEGISKEVVKWIEQCRHDKDFVEDLPREFAPRMPPPKFNLSEGCTEVLSGLLDPRPWKRLSTNRFEEMKQMAWFSDFDWEALQKHDVERLKAPIKPNANQANCDTVGNNLVDTLMGDEKQERLSEEEQQKFEGYDYAVELEVEGAEK